MSINNLSLDLLPIVAPYLSINDLKLLAATNKVTYSRMTFLFAELHRALTPRLTSFDWSDETSDFPSLVDFFYKKDIALSELPPVPEILADKIQEAHDLSLISFYHFLTTEYPLIPAISVDLNLLPVKEQAKVIFGWMQENHVALSEITDLDLDEQSPVILPKEIGLFFTGLEYLSLKNNALRILPDWIGNFKQLETLNLSENYLKDLPDSIHLLTHLVDLDLSKNEMTFLPNNICYLTNLEVINISCNKLETFPSWLHILTELGELDIGYNDFESIPNVIFDLPALNHLNLEGNRLTHLPDCDFLQKLTSLELQENNFKTLPYSIITTFSKEDLIGYVKEKATLNICHMIANLKNPLSYDDFKTIHHLIQASEPDYIYDDMISAYNEEYPTSPLPIEWNASNSNTLYEVDIEGLYDIFTKIIEEVYFPSSDDDDVDTEPTYSDYANIPFQYY